MPSRKVAALVLLATILFVALLLRRDSVVETLSDGRTVMIDPGHGGIDGGTASGAILEKDINLDIGRRVIRHLSGGGLPVSLSREGDNDLAGLSRAFRSRVTRDLDGRVRLAAARGANALVSIHVDHFRASDVRGPRVYYRPGSWESLEMAGYIQAELNALDPSFGGKPVASDFYLLRNFGGQAVLVEVGFLSNPSDREQLATSAHRERVARAIAAGILKFYRTGAGR